MRLLTLFLNTFLANKIFANSIDANRKHLHKLPRSYPLTILHNFGGPAASARRFAASPKCRCRFYATRYPLNEGVNPRSIQAALGQIIRAHSRYRPVFKKVTRRPDESRHHLSPLFSPRLTTSKSVSSKIRGQINDDLLRRRSFFLLAISTFNPRRAASYPSMFADDLSTLSTLRTESCVEQRRIPP